MSNVPKVANFITHSFPVTSSKQNTVLFCSPARPLHSAAVVTGDILNNPQTRRWVLGAALAVEGQHPGASTSPGGCIGSPGSALLESRGCTHSEHRFPAPSSREGCRKQVLGVGGLHCQSRVSPIWVQVAALAVQGGCTDSQLKGHHPHMGPEGCNDSQGSAPLQSKVSTPIRVQRTALTVTGQQQRAALTVTISTRRLH